MTKLVEKKLQELKTIENVSKELKRLQSARSRLLKQSGKSTFEEDLKKLLVEEQVIKQVRTILSPKEKTVPEYTATDIEKLDYDSTCKAIRTIQSKMSNSKWITSTAYDNDEYRNAEKIEKMLQDHKLTVKPIEDGLLKKKDLVTIIDVLESNTLSQETIIEMLKKLL